MDTKLRSLTKAALWTLLGVLVMTAVGFLFTGSVAIGGAMAVLNACLGFVLYLLYERIWDRISWGRHDAT